MSPDTVLTPIQEQVLSLIAAGSTATAAAASAGIHRNTVGNWLRSSRAFSRALASVHFNRALYWREQAETLAPAAVDAIRDIMVNFSAPAAVRLKASLAILDKAAAPLLPPPTPESVQPESVHPESVHPKSMHNRAQVTPPSPSQPRAKIGRNQACPCGSGKKFKHCCLSPPAAASPSPVPVSE